MRKVELPHQKAGKRSIFTYCNKSKKLKCKHFSVADSKHCGTPDTKEIKLLHVYKNGDVYL